MKIIEDFKIFVSSNRRSVWLDDGILKIFIRKSWRLWDNTIIECLDLANIGVDENMRGQGYFRLFLVKLLDTFPDKNILVESVLNNRLEKCLIESFYFEKKPSPEPLQVDLFLIRKTGRTVAHLETPKGILKLSLR